METECAAEMPKYISHKTVWALKIKEVQPVNADETGAYLDVEEDGYARIRVDADFMSKHSPEAGGYYVVYKDGYKSFSPAEAFEGGYTLCE